MVRRNAVLGVLVLNTLSMLVASPAVAQNCAPIYRIYFANGINNSFENARDSMVATSLMIGPSFKGFPISYDRIYHSSVSTGTAAIALRQILTADSSVKLTGSLLANVLLAFLDGAPVPSWLGQFLPEPAALDAINVATQQAATAMKLVNFQGATDLQRYEADLLLGRSVLVVAHSQGNLYANKAFDALAQNHDNAPFFGSFSVVSVATPDTQAVSGGIVLEDGTLGPGLYVTSPYDLVVGAVAALAPGTLGPSDGADDETVFNSLPYCLAAEHFLCLKSSDPDLLGHNYIKTYLNPGLPYRQEVFPLTMQLLGFLNTPFCNVP